jgi:hypothetical protein
MQEFPMKKFMLQNDLEPSKDDMNPMSKFDS